MERFDLLIVGAGAAGISAALHAKGHGKRVLLVEGAEAIGGTFHVSSGQMSAAGTRIQASKGIVDSPDAHFADVMRISRDTANPRLVRLAVDNAADTFHWLLDNGLEVLPEHPVVHYGHEPYSTARTYWGKDGGLSVLQVLRPLVERAVEAGEITLWLRTRFERLVLNSSGEVVGASFTGVDGPRAVEARNVLLTTGGFSANPELFSSLSQGQPLFGGGYHTSRGEGLEAARAAGAGLVNTDKFLPTFAAVEDPASMGGYTFVTQTYPQFRQPWELYVDQQGKRFVREDEPSVDTRERALLALPGMSFWALYDERIRREAPSFFVDRSQEEIQARFNVLSSYRSASSLQDLAASIGADAQRLVATVDAYNSAIAAGTSDPMGRVHRPLPLSEPPFYAIRHVGWSIVGFAGLSVDDQLRVLDAHGRVIPHLYAAGEILGIGITSGNAFVGGMSVTPAMTFGRLLGSRLASA